MDSATLKHINSMIEQAKQEWKRRYYQSCYCYHRGNSRPYKKYWKADKRVRYYVKLSKEYNDNLERTTKD